MRIIAGLYRGRKIKTLPGLQVRPTPDRLRETLFDVLGSSVKGAVFIDAYAGSGAVGIEALSRGARQVAWIEESAAACRIIQANLASLGARDDDTSGNDIRDQATRGRSDVLQAPVRRGLRRLQERGFRAHFYFLDPPYSDRREYDQSIRWLSENQAIEPGGLIIFQHSKRELLDERAGRLIRERLLTQGSNALSFYRFDG